jgi:hypothetical protein
MARITTSLLSPRPSFSARSCRRRTNASLCQEVPSVLSAACEVPFGRCFLYLRCLTRGLPRNRVWPSSRRTSRSFVLAPLRALQLDLRRRRRQGRSDRGMASSVPATGGTRRRTAGDGRRVVTGSGSGLSEEPVPGVRAGRAGDRVVPLLPSRALRTGCSAPGVGLQAGEGSVADLPFQRAQGLLGGLALGQFPVVAGPALAVPVADLGGRSHVDGVVEPPVPAPGQPAGPSAARRTPRSARSSYKRSSYKRRSGPGRETGTRRGHRRSRRRR